MDIPGHSYASLKIGVTWCPEDPMRVILGHSCASLKIGVNRCPENTTRDIPG